ncbi:Molybdopterin-synthase adenylyltransferase [Pontiella desulfatans]|uniref:Molybdopterin-synthase adenylyltransferase n=1 Tax=Pontiella desulfatans TaxID=2750659 RepID=A0A6C2U1C6_PONDE|nr:ThiF family adenylyltransferase [Pontiella desulfatans]VGO13683.1 Molybdopterin-synthase adenylyltransferase [Pontiella desulfatans]
MQYKLRIAGIHYAELRDALYPGDWKEAGAIAVCGRRGSEGCTTLLVQKIHAVPFGAYQSREPDYLEWDTQWMIDVLNHAESEDLSLIKFHSHPGGGSFFSERDDLTDIGILNEWSILYDRATPHGSVIMLPDGELFGRMGYAGHQFIPIESIAVAGNQLHYWQPTDQECVFSDAESRNLQTFGAGTTAILKRLKVGVIGCSGTGSIVVEQLARLGVGHLVLVDPDIVEKKNLNRVLNTTEEDAVNERSKVDVLSDAIQKMGFETQVTRIATNLVAPKPIQEIASCDVVFGCVDGAEGRHILNRISSYYVIPYFDVGIDLQASEHGGISQVTGAVHYIQPGGSSLLSRGIYSQEEVEAEALRRSDPELYANHLKQNYIAGVKEDSPAVLPINMHYASLLVLEFLARIHKYRITDDAELAIQQYNLEDVDNVYRAEDGLPCAALAKRVGRGDTTPLLDIIGLE